MRFVKNKTEFFSILTIICSLLTIIFSVQTINFTKLRLEKQRAEGAEISLLPDYHNRREALKDKRRKCDNDTTKIIKYDGSDYYAVEANLASENSFIMVFWARSGLGAHYWMQTGTSEPTELQYQEWVKKISEEKLSPNYINLIRKAPNDCYEDKKYSPENQDE